jgi:hypothetical protein
MKYEKTTMKLSKLSLFSFVFILVIGIIGIPITIYGLSKTNLLVSSHANAPCESTHWQVVRTNTATDAHAKIKVSLYNLFDDQGNHCHEFFTSAVETLTSPLLATDTVTANILADAPTTSTPITTGQTVHLNSKAYTIVNNCAKATAALMEVRDGVTHSLPQNTKGAQTQTYCEK